MRETEAVDTCKELVPERKHNQIPNKEFKKNVLGSTKQGGRYSLGIDFWLLKPVVAYSRENSDGQSQAFERQGQEDRDNT